ncbi:MAG TPA: hypothetical protein VFC19_05845 [Candidatus Limnocylindrales bacterium]|nr:hypothetical protein [Candidatus Limnocylindrales bacterium]
MRKLGFGIIGLLVLAALAGCGDEPPPTQTQADEVARLQAHVVPVVDELKVLFYLDEGSSCNAILYSSGEFRDGDDSCGSPTERYGQFDSRVRGDFDRIDAAIGTSKVPTHRFDATFTTGGALREVTFPREDSSWQWNWSYLYDPGDTVAKDLQPGDPKVGVPKYRRINEDWWLVTAVDD